MGRMNIEEAMETLDPKEIQVSVDAFEDLEVRFADGRVYKNVQALRAFPLSEAMKFIVLKDEKGKEIGMIEDLEELGAPSRKVLKEELEKRYFMPKIVRIHRIDESYGIPRWDVETDRGPRHFELQTRQDARRVGGGRVLIKDVDRNRYEIPDVRKLDPQSRAFVEAEV